MTTEHVHHYVPRRDGKTSTGEPAFVQMCECGLTQRGDALPTGMQDFLIAIGLGRWDSYLDLISDCVTARERALRAARSYRGR